MLSAGEETEQLMLETAVGLCLCELASGLVRKLQGTGAKASGPDLACVSWYLAL
jgi:hypothetical protein